MRRRRGLLLGLTLGMLVVAGASPSAAILGGPSVPFGTTWTLFSAEAVATTDSVSSEIVDQAGGLFFGVWYVCTSASGTPDVALAWLESPSTDDPDFAVAVTLVANLTVETPQVTAVSPPPMRYGRLRLTGNAANPADTLCTAKLFVQGR